MIGFILYNFDINFGETRIVRGYDFSPIVDLVNNSVL